MRLNQLTLPVSAETADATAAFYEALGLTRIVDSGPRYVRFECPDADGGEPATLSLQLVPGWSGADWPLAYFEVDDVDAALARLKAHGVAPEAGPADEPWLWREAVLRDPAGNRLKIYAAGDNRRFPPWRVETA